MSGVDLPAILAFVNARLDEREEVARKAGSGCGCHPPAPSWAFDDEATDGRIVIVNDPHPDVPRKLTRRWNRSYDGLFHAEHIALNDPQFVLADVESKRRIVDWAVALLETLPNDPAAALMFQQAGDELLRQLAAPFAQHPDFDPAWAVET